MAELIEQRATQKEFGLNRPILTMDAALLQNYDKGIVKGLRMAASLPTDRASSLREQFTDLLEEERQHVNT